jgi:hypothetical protein
MVLGESRFCNKEYKKTVYATFRIRIRNEERLLIRIQEDKNDSQQLQQHFLKAYEDGWILTGFGSNSRQADLKIKRNDRSHERVHRDFSLNVFFFDGFNAI